MRFERSFEHVDDSQRALPVGVERRVVDRYLQPKRRGVSNERGEQLGRWVCI
jgi:hypothetical protein